MTLVHKTSGYLSSYLLLLKIILQWIPLYTYHLAHVNSFCQQIFVYLSHARLCSCAEITKISKLDRAPAIKLLSAQCRSYTCLIVNQSSSKALDLNLGCTLELPGKTFKKKKILVPGPSQIPYIQVFWREVQGSGLSKRSSDDVNAQPSLTILF